ncbi:MAG: hypothetical protein L3J65_01000 [Robiginitomaculum sp.]|nr:hypothetical protein [Robiginitomaculum sp.]
MKHYAIRHKGTGKYLGYVNQNNTTRKLEFAIQLLLWKTLYGLLSNLIKLRAAQAALKDFEIVTFDVVITRDNQAPVKACTFFDKAQGEQRG